MTTPSHPHPKFDRPPVSEVACGWFFEPIPLYTAAIGALWSRFQADFPLTQDVPRRPPPLPPDELFTARVTVDAPGLAVPLVWFLSEDERRLVQVQFDRFCFNWRRREAGDPYPEYGAVYTDFQRHLTTFRDFAREAGWELRPTACELTYINRVRDPLVDGPGQLHRVVGALSWPGTPGVLGRPRALGWQAAFDLPGAEGVLKVTARDADPMVQLDLVARGPATEGWYDAAHDAIVRAFAEMTTPEAHAAWGRREGTA